MRIQITSDHRSMDQPVTGLLRDPPPPSHTTCLCDKEGRIVDGSMNRLGISATPGTTFTFASAPGPHPTIR